jgi:hypothetical protein
MHTLRRHPMLLPQRLLSQTVSLHSLFRAVGIGRRLLSKVAFVPLVFWYLFTKESNWRPVS